MAGPTPDIVPRAGRPRSERVRLAILEATADLLEEGGLAAASIEAIATRAGVSKVTIYRWWPSRGAVAVDSYFHRYRETVPFEDVGDLAHELRTHILTLIKMFRGRAGQIMAELIGQAQSDPALGEMIRSRWLAPRREATMVVLRRAVERGEIRDDVDFEALMDQLYGPIYYRLSMGHAPLTPALAERLVTTALDGVRIR